MYKSWYINKPISTKKKKSQQYSTYITTSEQKRMLVYLFTILLFRDTPWVIKIEASACSEEQFYYFAVSPPPDDRTFSTQFVFPADACYLPRQHAPRARRWSRGVYHG